MSLSNSHILFGHKQQYMALHGQQEAQLSLRDVSCQLKSCQLPRNSAETNCTTSPEQIDVMNLEG